MLFHVIRIHSIVLFLILSFITSSYALSSWEVLPKETELHFTGTQNNSPVNGIFKKFDSNIQFDPERLQESHIVIKININSLYTPYAEVSDTLLSSDWFDASTYPTALFQSKEFIKKDAKNYEAIGTLTIKNHTHPVKLSFTLDAYSPQSMTVHGLTNIKRTDFEIGKGEWADTNVIKDDVTIHFNLKAVTKNISKN